MKKPEVDGGSTEKASFKRPYPGLPVETLTARYVERRFKPHAHGEYLIGVITAGVHSVWCRGERHDASGGTVVTMHPGDVHHGGAGAETGWTQRMLYIGEDAMRELLRDAAGDRPQSSPSFRAPFHRHPALAARLAQLHDAVHRSPLALPRDTALTALATLLGSLAGARKELAGPGHGPDTRVRRMLDYLHAHASEDVGLDALGALVGLGRRQTIDVFKRRVGLPPHAYHLGLKVRLVQQMLREGAKPAQAAADAGFADQSHMTRHFAAMVGTTPAAFAQP